MRGGGLGLGGGGKFFFRRGGGWILHRVILDLMYAPSWRGSLGGIDEGGRRGCRRWGSLFCRRRRWRGRGGREEGRVGWWRVMGGSVIGNWSLSAGGRGRCARRRSGEGVGVGRFMGGLWVGCEMVLR